MSVKMKVEIEVIDFEVPTKVGVTGYEQLMNVEKLNWEVLDRLCRNFRKSIFENAKMKDSRGG